MRGGGGTAWSLGAEGRGDLCGRSGVWEGYKEEGRKREEEDREEEGSGEGSVMKGG